MGEGATKRNNHSSHTRTGGSGFISRFLTVRDIDICAASVGVLFVLLDVIGNSSFVGFFGQIGISWCCIFFVYFAAYCVHLCLRQKFRLSGFDKTQHIKGGRALYV